MLALLGLSLLVFTVLISIVYSTLTTGMSPQPSHRLARQQILAQTAQLCESANSPQRIVDLGSGWGHLIIPLAKRFPEHQIQGYEVSFFPWLVSWLLKKIFGLDNLQIHRGDFFKADFAQADLLICYLVRPSMQRLADRLHRMPAPPQRLISHFFSLPGYQPCQTWQLQDWYSSPLYLYRLDSKAEAA